MMDFCNRKGADALVIGDCSCDLMHRADAWADACGSRVILNRKSGDSGVRGADRRGVSRCVEAFPSGTRTASICIRKIDHAIRCYLPWGSNGRT